MNIREFLLSPDVQLPIVRGTDDFQGFIEAKLDAYLQLLGQLAHPTELVEEVLDQRSSIEAFCKSGKEIVRATFAGHPHDAYSQFLEGVAPLLTYIQRQSLNEVKTTDLRFLYRVRRQITPSFAREDLFHIPFQHRHKVSTQRYSIPGLPCLYFGGSLYTCWAEMGRPPFHELHAAAFWLKSDTHVRVLNFSDRPARLLLYVDPAGNIPPDSRIRELLTTHLILWPLMALCSITVKHRDSPYKPEYILPQIVLQWVTKEHNFDGICYFSTHVEAVTGNPLPPCNLVFPAREIKAQGRCSRLRRLFKMTSPHPWELLRAVHAGEGMPGMAVPTFDFEFIDGRKEPYHHTEFGNVQSKLNKLAFDIIAKNQSGEIELGDVAE